VCERHVGLPEAVPLQTLDRDKPAQEGRRCWQLQAAIWKEVCDEGCLRPQVSPHFFRCDFNEIGIGSDQPLCISAEASAPIDFKQW